MCVRLAYPWVDPGVWRFFFFRTTVGSYLHTFVLDQNKTPHTGVNPGKLNERTHYRQVGVRRTTAYHLLSSTRPAVFRRYHSALKMAANFTV